MLKSHKKLFFTNLLLLLLINLIFIFYINSVKEVIDSVLDKRYQDVFLYLFFTVGVLILDIVFNYLQVITNKRLYNDMNQKIRTQFFEKINHMTLPKLESYHQNDLMTRFIDDITGVVTFYTKDLLSIIGNLLMFIILFVYIGLNEPLLLPFVVLLIPMIVIFIKIKGKRLKVCAEDYQETLSFYHEETADIIHQVLNIKAYQKEDYFYKRYLSKQNDLENKELKQNKQRITIWIFSIMIYHLIFISFYGIGGYLSFIGSLSFSFIISLFLLIDKLVDTLMSLPDLFSSVYEVMPKLKRLKQVYQEEDASITSFIEVKNPIICMKDVSYHYQQDKPVLSGINLKITQNARICVIGESGSGKSTILKLMLGYDEASSGEIKVNGTLSYCPQEVSLLSKTIRDNLDICVSELNTEMIHDLLKIVCLDMDISQFTDGIDTFIGKNGNILSGGQKHRLNLLMSLLKTSDILLIDEGFKALDKEMTLKILSQLFNFYQGAIVVVTHKLNEDILRLFDEIVFIEEGKVGKSGPFDVLLSYPPYKTLYEKVNGREGIQ